MKDVDWGKMATAADEPVVCETEDQKYVCSHCGNESKNPTGWCVKGTALFCPYCDYDVIVCPHCNITVAYGSADEVAATCPCGATCSHKWQYDDGYRRCKQCAARKCAPQCVECGQFPDAEFIFPADATDDDIDATIDAAGWQWHQDRGSRCPKCVENNYFNDLVCPKCGHAESWHHADINNDWWFNDSEMAAANYNLVDANKVPFCCAKCASEQGLWDKDANADDSEALLITDITD